MKCRQASCFFCQPFLTTEGARYCSQCGIELMHKDCFTMVIPIIPFILFIPVQTLALRQYTEIAMQWYLNNPIHSIYPGSDNLLIPVIQRWLSVAQQCFVLVISLIFCKFCFCFFNQCGCSI